MKVAALWVALVAMALWVSPASAGLPDGRAYELVSPAAKQGGDVIASVERTQVANNGDSATFTSFAAFARALGSGVTTEYASFRGPEGWKTHPLTPPQEPQGWSTALQSVTPTFVKFAPDLSAGVFLAFSPITDAPNVSTLHNLYLREDVLTPGIGQWALLGDASTPQIAPGLAMPFVVDATPDFGHVLFESKQNLLDGVAPCPDLSVLGYVNGCPPKLYHWDHGTLRLAGVLPNGVPAVCPDLGDQVCATAGHGSAAVLNTAAVSKGALSVDGSRVFFGAPVRASGALASDAQLYMRENDTTTVLVNASERTDCAGDPSCGGDNVPDPAPEPGGPRQARFWGATPSGDRAYFTSEEQLTDAPVSGFGLYVYDASKQASAPDNLTLLSVDQEPSDDLADASTVQGVIGFSDDGEYVYFLARGQLVAGAPTDGALGRPRVYVWHAGSIRYIGALDPGGSDGSRALGQTVERKTARVTSSGRHLLFTASRGDQLTGYDHGPASRSQVYVYDFDGNGGAGELMCASCNPSGASATADASPIKSSSAGNVRPLRHLNRAISEDGRRAYFTSGEALVVADDNGVDDVYQFDTETKSLHLISSGKEASVSMFVDASPSGDDVMFVTRERLVGIDVDNAYDLYDARVGGGIAAQNPPLSPGECVGADACQGSVSEPPVSLVPSSVAFGGGSGPSFVEGLFGDLNGVVAVLRAHRLSGKQQRQLATRGRTRVRVTVSERGRVAVRARARVGGRVRLVGSASRVALRGGTIELVLRLSSSARRQLRDQGRLRLTLTVSYSKVLGSQRAVVTLRRGGRA